MAGQGTGRSHLSGVAARSILASWLADGLLGSHLLPVSVTGQQKAPGWHGVCVMPSAQVPERPMQNWAWLWIVKSLLPEYMAVKESSKHVPWLCLCEELKGQQQTHGLEDQGEVPSL